MENVSMDTRSIEERRRAAEECRRAAIKGQILAITPTALRALGERLADEGHSLATARPEIQAAYSRLRSSEASATDDPSNVSAAVLLASLKRAFGGEGGRLEASSASFHPDRPIEGETLLRTLKSF